MSSYSSRLTMSKCLCHKSPKDKAVFQLIRDFIVSTSALGMPPPYIKHACVHRFRSVSVMLMGGWVKNGNFSVM